MKNSFFIKNIKSSSWLLGLSLATVISCSTEEESIDSSELNATNSSLATPSDGRIYTIRNRDSGRTMDIEGKSNSNGANLQVFGTNSNTGSTHRQWEVISTGGKYFRLKGVDSGKSLEIDGGKNSNGANAQQRSYSGATHQQWELISTGSGYFRIKGRDSGKSLRASGSSNGSNVDQASWDGDQDQQWFFTQKGSNSNNGGGSTTPDDDDDDDGGSTGGSGSANAIIGGNWKLNAYTGNLNVSSSNNGLRYADDASKSDNNNWFFDNNGYAYFKCYAGNPTSSDNTSNPRSELRELNSNGSLANWDGTTNTEHSMKWRVRIDDLPPSGKIAFGQIHAESGSKFDDVIRTQVQGDNGQNSGSIDLRINGYVTEELLGGGQTIDFDMRMDTEYYFELTMRNKIVRLYSLNSNGSRNRTLFTSGSVDSDGNYFKAGCYLQSTKDSQSSSNVFGLVGIKNISVKH